MPKYSSTIKKCIIYLLISSLLLIVIYKQRVDTELKSIKLYSPAEQSNFYVIIPYFNPIGYKNRLRLYRMFEDHMKTFDVKLITIELAYENRLFEVTQKHNPNHIQLRTSDIMFYKENLINIAIKKLPRNCEYVAWIDADVEFKNLNWVHDTKTALKEYKVVQLFEFTELLGPQNETVEAFSGMAHAFVHGLLTPYGVYKRKQLMMKHFNNTKIVYGKFARTGLGWACKKELLIQLGGLFDKHILGAGDNVMAVSFIDREVPLVFNISKQFELEFIKWREKCNKYVKKKVGYVKGDLRHYWHGSRTNRKYNNKESIFDSGPELFDSSLHLYYDENGLLKYTNRMRDYLFNSVKQYLIDRKEDE